MKLTDWIKSKIDDNPAIKIEGGEWVHGFKGDAARTLLGQAGDGYYAAFAPYSAAELKWKGPFKTRPEAQEKGWEMSAGWRKSQDKMAELQYKESLSQRNQDFAHVVKELKKGTPALEVQLALGKARAGQEVNSYEYASRLVGKAVCRVAQEKQRKLSHSHSR